jgi:hypothetical protein
LRAFLEAQHQTAARYISVSAPASASDAADGQQYPTFLTSSSTGDPTESILSRLTVVRALNILVDVSIHRNAPTHDSNNYQSKEPNRA